MKTERMVLLVTPEEKARISKEATKLGISASEFVRKTAAALDADDLTAIDELKDIMPEAEASLDRMEATLTTLSAELDEHREVMRYQASDAYREQVRTTLLADPTIDWQRVRAVFGGRNAEAAE